MTQEQIKALVERYPYLLPRNIETGEIPEDYDYTYISSLAIPEGWNRLFLQMCEDIRQPLIDAGYLDKFRFSQVKEKYNTLRCYHFGAPKSVDEIIRKYEIMAKYVCTKCGKPATIETQGYIASYCDDCYNKLRFKEQTNFSMTIEFKNYFIYTSYNGKTHKEVKEKISFKDEWDRYVKKLENNEL